MFRLALTFTIIFCSILVAFSQSKRGNNGVFGFDGFIDLDFNTGAPLVKLLKPFDEGNMLSDEGCASISDLDGNLLFYTNGEVAYDRYGTLMLSGFNLCNFTGSVSTSQALIIPIPKDPFRYYIISIQSQGGNLLLAEVDMRLNNGLGDVVSKNTILDLKSSEKICTIKHSNGEAVWLLSHSNGNNEFKVFLIDENGINLNPVISSAGLPYSENVWLYNEKAYPNTNAIGYMKPSHDGKLIACAIMEEINALELFQFNSSSGEVSNPVQLNDTPLLGAYGIEFSPDDTKLYVSTNLNVLQFDLLAGTREQINNSSTILRICERRGGALQLGPDGKIYVVGHLLCDSLDVIENPNGVGINCIYHKNGLPLKGASVRLGLPEFIYNSIDPEITYDTYCLPGETTFKLIRIKSFKSIIWDFGDPASGSNNLSSEIKPKHRYTAPGKYKVKINITFDDQTTFSYSQPVVLFPTPIFSVGPDTTKCPGYLIFLNPTPKPDPSLIISMSENFTYSFQAGEIQYRIDDPGKYWVTFSSQLCSFTDTINVTPIFAPPEIILKDTTLCYGQTLPIHLTDGYSYTWNDGIKSNERVIKTSGHFSVHTENQCGKVDKAFHVDYLKPLHLALPKDTVLCTAKKLTLDVSNPSASYLWQNGSDQPTYAVSEKGDYWVKVFNRCEVVQDTIHVYYVNDKPIFIPNVVTLNGDNVNDHFMIDETIADTSIRIFDRWGDVIYSSEHYKDQWPEADLASGIYYYSIYERCSDTILKGTVSVLK